MTSDDTRVALVQEAFERVGSMPDDLAWAPLQSGFNTALAVFRWNTETALWSADHDLNDVPFGEVVALLPELTTRPLHVGAHAFASLSRQPDVRRDAWAREATIGFSELWAPLVELSQSEDSAVKNAFHAATVQIGCLDEVLAVVHRNLVEKIAASPLFERREELFSELIGHHLACGVQIEFCVAHLLEDHDHEKGFFARIVEAVTGNNNLDDASNLATFGAAVGNPDSIHPWPLDLHCICGKSLGPAIFCCDPETPIAPESFSDSLTESFRLQRSCCGQEFQGFRCDACARVYSWTSGIVDSVSGRGSQ